MISLVFLTFFIWSTTFAIGRATLLYSPPLFLTGVRMLLAGLILLGFLWVKKERFGLKRSHLLPLFLLGLSSVYLTNALEFWGLQFLTSAKACFIYSLSPFLSALFSYIQFREKITPRKVVGLSIGFLGFLPVLLSPSGDEGLVATAGGLPLPELSLIGATITSVYGWVLLRKLGKEDGLSPMLSNGASMVLGGILALVHSLFVENWNPLPVTKWQPFIQGVALMIVVSNLICYNLYGFLLKHFTATFLSFAGLLTPVFAAFFGWLFLRETVSWSFFFSVGVILTGLWLVYAEELRLGYIIKKKEKSPSR